MAKGQKKDGFEILIWEAFRGTGRQLGRSIAKGAERQIKKTVLDDKSKLRVAMDKFEITGTLKGSLQRVYKVIDLFDEEYNPKNNPAFLQASIYKKDDIRRIEDKLRNVSRLIFTDVEERAYDRCLDFWEEIKERASNE